MMQDFSEVVKGGVYGVCVGDAVGVPAEFRECGEYADKVITEMVEGGVHGQPAGTWSDDSSMMLCLLYSMAETGGIHTHDIMNRFLDWFEKGKYSPWGERFDCGNTVAQALGRYQDGVTPALCGGNKPNCNGNGSLMRILPMAYALYPQYGADLTRSGRAMEWIHKVSGLTHRHALAQSACGIYVNIATRLIEGYKLYDAVCEGITASLFWYRKHERFENAEEYWKRISDIEFLKLLPETEVPSGGYVLDTMEAALWCLLRTDNYRDCILKAVNLGGDPDTTAAIAGGLAGLCYGSGGIPEEWMEKLAGKDIIDEACEKMSIYMERIRKDTGRNTFRTGNTPLACEEKEPDSGKGVMPMASSAEQHQMCDIHMHVIPGVDDGSWNLDMSYSMLAMAWRQGIRKIIAAPHSSAFDEHSGLVKAAFSELERQTHSRFPDMDLYLGSEVYCRKGNLEEVLAKLKSGFYPPMNRTQYILTEFSTGIEQEEAVFCIEALLGSGWIPVIAHVERYKNLFGNRDFMELLKEKGALLQINVFSVFEERDGKIKGNALDLVERGLVDFLGSDGHRTNHRPPGVERGLKYLYHNFDAEYIDEIAFRNAEHLLRLMPGERIAR